MNRQELINKIKASNVHVWSKTMAGKEEVFVEGRIEYFENFVNSIIDECIGEMMVFDHHINECRDILPNIIDAVNTQMRVEYEHKEN